SNFIVPQCGYKKFPYSRICIQLKLINIQYFLLFLDPFALLFPLLPEPLSSILIPCHPPLIHPSIFIRFSHALALFQPMFHCLPSIPTYSTSTLDWFHPKVILSFLIPTPEPRKHLSLFSILTL